MPKVELLWNFSKVAAHHWKLLSRLFCFFLQASSWHEAKFSCRHWRGHLHVVHSGYAIVPLMFSLQELNRFSLNIFLFFFFQNINRQFCQDFLLCLCCILTRRFCHAVESDGNLLIAVCRGASLAGLRRRVPAVDVAAGIVQHSGCCGNKLDDDHNKKYFWKFLFFFSLRVAGKSSWKWGWNNAGHVGLSLKSGEKRSFDWSG